MKNVSQSVPHGNIHIGVAWINRPNSANVYIGKGSGLGNPYAKSNMSIDERNDACDKYIPHFYKQVGFMGTKAYSQLLHIYDLVIAGTDVNLQCYCHDPVSKIRKRCHAETIKDYVDDCVKGGYHPSKFAEPIVL